MRILITGGAGFIGSHVVDELVMRGHEPSVVDDLSSGTKENLPEDVPLMVGDIRDELFLDEAFGTFRPDGVCHLAAQMSVSRSVREPAFDADVNIVGLLRVLDCCHRYDARRFVFASSGGALYGDVTSPVTEEHPCRPAAPYGISKRVGERYLEFYAREFGLSCFAMRYTNVYGPRQNPHGEAGVVAIFSTLMLNGKEITINGDGKYVRDYVYAADVARANVDALESDAVEPFVALNVGTGIGTDVNELSEFLRQHCEASRATRNLSAPIPVPVYGVSRAGDLRSSLVSHERITRLFGWKPQVDIAEGLAQTVESFAR